MSIAEKLQTIADNEQKVYEAGKKAEWDAFWEAYQYMPAPYNSLRTDYHYAFHGDGWSDKTFYPKYDIIPEGSCQRIFDYFGMNSMRINGSRYLLNLVERLKECGVIFDTSQCKSLAYMVAYGAISHFGVLDFSSLSNANNVFYAAQYTTNIEKIISKESLTWITAFKNATALEEIRFEGTIGNNIDFNSCTKLSYDSLISIIGALKDYSADTSGTTYICKLGSTNLEKLTDTEKAIATEKGWTIG